MRRHKCLSTLLNVATVNKTDIRKRCQSWRSSISEEEWASKSSAICSKLGAIEQLRLAQTVHAFWPIHAKREVNICPLLAALVSEGKEVLLPIMDGSTLKYGRFESESDLTLVSFGVFEPREMKVFSPEEIDVVLVPALAVDSSGNRIGYGKGFYDRFLSKCNALKIVPLFENQVIDGIPYQVHDVPFDIFVTEQRIYRVT